MAASGDYWLPCSPQPTEPAVTEMVTGGSKRDQKTARCHSQPYTPCWLFRQRCSLRPRRTTSQATNTSRGDARYASPAAGEQTRNLSAADHRRPVQRSHVEARTGVRVSAPSTGAPPASRTRTASAFPVAAACVKSDGAVVAPSAKAEWLLGKESAARKKK
jgi:hypothetical protein